jgi:hypothetical protein
MAAFNSVFNEGVPVAGIRSDAALAAPVEDPN